MNRAEASRKNARGAGYITCAIRALKKKGFSHEEAKEIARESWKVKKWMESQE